MSAESRQRPVVLVPACNRMLGQHPFGVAGRKYTDAVRLAGALPLIVPGLDSADFDTALSLAHGVLLSGSASNLHPSHFGEKAHDASLPQDPERDAWVLPFIRRVLERGMPLFAICRGAQEVNVALGGSLYQSVQEVPGLNDHRADGSRSAEIQYGPAHEVAVQPGGLLAQLLGERDITVNSVHGQGVKQLARGLRVEALAADGLVEAFSLPSAPGFNLCVQWHPEWQAAGNPVSVRLLQAFGGAVRQYRSSQQREPLRRPATVRSA